MPKTIVLGITSGIAAFKALELIQLLRQDGHDVFIVMTQHATQMVDPKEFEKTSGHPVASELFSKDFSYQKVLKDRKVEHIELADRADLLVILPATANTLAKLANGLADDFLTTMTLAVTSPVLIFPSMNVHMWHHPSLQQNLQKLKNYGYQIFDPCEGLLACGYEGKGRLPEIREIHQEISRQLAKNDSLKDRKVLITAGGTIEKIDDVRFIANKSSGKMAAALADAAYLRGADVTFLHATNSALPRFQMKTESFETADELWELVQKYLPTTDIFFHPAAVGDFQIENAQKGKIASDDSHSLTLKISPRLKISDQIKKLNPAVFFVAFKAEFGLSEEGLKKAAEQKLGTSHADAVVANDISKPDRGFQADTNEVLVVLRNDNLKNGRGSTTHKIPLAAKTIIADQLLDLLVPHLP